MTEIKIYCDHCGKVLDNKNDFPKIYITYEADETVDLCKKCYFDLVSYISEFCTRNLRRI